MTLLKKATARILGNFGISFFTPLASINIGKAIFEIQGGLNFSQILIVSLIAATITVGLSISREAVEYGIDKNQ